MIAVLLSMVGYAGTGCLDPEFECPGDATCECSPDGQSWTIQAKEKRRRVFAGPTSRPLMKLYESSDAARGGWLVFDGWNEQGRHLCGAVLVAGKLEHLTELEVLDDAYVLHETRFSPFTGAWEARMEIVHDQQWRETAVYEFAPTADGGSELRRACAHPRPCERNDKPCRRECTDDPGTPRSKLTPTGAPPTAPAACPAGASCASDQGGRVSTWTDTDGDHRIVRDAESRVLLRTLDRDGDGVPDDIQVELFDRSGRSVCSAKVVEKRLVERTSPRLEDGSLSVEREDFAGEQ